MEEYPKVVYKETLKSNTDYSEEIDNIFKKLEVKDVPEELLNLRKQQIQNHNYCDQLVYSFNGLINLIGQKDDECNRLLMKQFQEELIQLHSPVYVNVPVNAEPFHKWEQWTFEELYDKYFDLAMRKGWEDFYGLAELSNFEKGEYLYHIKNYHIIDMLNDLIINDCIICGYEIRSFMNNDNNLRLLEPFNYDIFDKVIEVKLKEKFASMKEYHDSIFNSFKKEGK